MVIQSKNKVGLWLRAAALVCAAGLFAAAAHAEPGEDHPEVARFPGAVMAGYDHKDYEEFQLILSKPVERSNRYTADKLLSLEGQVTYIHYTVPKTASPLQVFRNYQSSLKRSGFSELFTCERPCTTANLGSFRDLMKARQLYLNYGTDNQYLAYQRKNTYVSLWVNDGGVWLFVVQKEALNDGLMAITGESPIAKSLSLDGKVDLYGFQFDTGKAVLRDGSRATLQELGRVLQDNPSLQVEIVGHTDDVGGLDANQRLSEARAQAVADALVKTYAVDGSRLSTRGLGQTAPLASNGSDTGRAKNRRVEIIAVRANAPVAAAPVNPPRATSAAVASPPAVAAPTPQPAAPARSSSLMDDAAKAVDAANKLKNLFGL
jgi:OmpA-OmpF porin, OOP family